MLDNTVAEASAREWLRAAYGDGEAVKAMRVPWELRVQLYPELAYGPAFREVREFFAAASEPAEPTKFFWAVTQMWDKLWKLYKGNEVLRGRPDEDRFLYSVMQRQAERMFIALPEGMLESVAVVALALSAEWLDQSSRDALAPLLVEMNDVLTALGLPALDTLAPAWGAAR